MKVYEEERVQDFRSAQQSRIHYLWVLVVYAPKRPGVKQKLVERTAIHPIRVCVDGWFFHEHNFTCDHRVYC